MSDLDDLSDLIEALDGSRSDRYLGARLITALVYQEAQFASYPLRDLEAVKASHGWRNMIIFSDITNDSTAHTLYTLKFVQLILRRTCQEGIAIIYT